MPTPLNRSSLRAATDVRARPGATHARAHAHTHADERAARAARGIANAHAAHAARMSEAHETGAHAQRFEWFSQGGCTACEAHLRAQEEDRRTNSRAALWAHYRAYNALQRALSNPASPDAHNAHTPRRYTRLNLDLAPVWAGDSTRNGTRRSGRATQRYAHSDATRVLSDATLTNERSNATRVARSTARHLLRDEEGRVDTVASAALLTLYLHALACKTPS